MAETLENQALHLLGQVVNEDAGENIVALGMVKNVSVSEGKIDCIIEFKENDQKKNEKIFEDAQKALKEIPGVTKVNIITTLHKENSTHANDEVNSDNKTNSVGTNQIKYILAVASGKGGVGKSTVMGYMVNDENPIIWRGLMVMKAINEMIDKVNWGAADIMVIDLPPGTGDVQLSLIQKLKISGSLIVTTPQDIALIDVIRGLKMFEKTKVPILGIVENMSYFLAPDTGKEYKLYGESKTNEVAEKYDYEILANLPHDPLLLEQCEKGHPLTDLVPDHKVSQMFIELAENLLKRLKLEQLANTN